MKKPILLILSFLSFYSCSSYIKDTAYPTLSDGKYDSEFPYKSSSTELEKISKSIRMLNVMAFYKGFMFDKIYNLKRSNLSGDILEDAASKYFNFYQTSSGTATIIYNNLGKIALLTCSHIVDYPDTIITYYLNEDGTKSDIIESISFKMNQNNYIPELPANEKLEIVIKDEKLDIAVLSANIKQQKREDFPAINYPIGYARELEWGSFVYAFGYPLGQKMITKGIVSNPDFEGKSGFLIDAIFNKGFSGGLVLAIRDGVPNFELVGLVKSVPAEVEYILQPSVENTQRGINPVIPYEGEIFIEMKKSLKLGVTKVVPIESIVEYLKKNKKLLDKNHINLGNSIFSRHFSYLAD
ncbi:MAG: serine protease [Ignavibacteria bacterium]